MELVCALCQTGTLDWLIVVVVDSRWLGCVLPDLLLTFTIFSFSLFALCHFKSVEYFHSTFFTTIVAGIYCVCVSGWVSCACSSQKVTEQEELEPGRAVHYTWAEPTGSRELCWNWGTYSGKLKSEEVQYLSHNNVCAAVKFKTYKNRTLSKLKLVLSLSSGISQLLALTHFVDVIVYSYEVLASNFQTKW